jgi:hypothetical protein
MASYSRYGNKLSCTLEAGEIKGTRKDIINEDRRYMADMMGEFSKYKHRLGVEFSC